MRLAWFIIAWLPIMMIMVSGCGSSSPSPYVEQPPIRRDTQRAQELASKAVEIMAEDPQRAERLLRDALGADL